MARILASVCWTRRVEYAPPLRRLFAAFVDYLVLSFVVAPFTGRAIGDKLTSGGTPEFGDLMGPAIVFLLTGVAYSTAMHAWRGSTVGKIATRTVVVNDDGSAITPAVAFVRAVAFAAIFFVSLFVLAPIVVNELRPFWNPRRQTWHDQMARTVVVTVDSRNT
jgi:uncharacterized RDD family membrane protein YckC